MNLRPGAWIHRAYWCTLAALALAPWVLPIRSPFWLDETVTYWTTRGGFGDIVRRCTEWPHSILYTTIIRAMDLAGGHGEVYLRLPSLMAMGFAALLIYRIAKHEFDGEIARTAVVLFAAMPHVTYAAADARPYALAVAAVAGSTWLLLHWERSRRLAHGLAYSSTAALVVHFHLLFAPVLAVQAVYLARAVGRGRIKIVQALAAGACAAVLMAPLYPQYRAAFRTREAHSFAPRPDVADLMLAVAPWMLVLSFALAVTPVLLSRRAPTLRFPPAPRGLVGLLLGCALLPPAALWVVSVLGSSPMFVDRYLLSAAPGLALVWAVVLRSVEPIIVRRAALAGCVLGTLALALAFGTLFNHCRHRGNWMEALRLVEREVAKDGAPVLIRSQYIESDYVEWRSTPLEDSPLFSQLGYYRTRADFVPLPVSVSATAVEHLRQFATQVQPGHERFLLVSFDGPRPLGPMLDAVERATGSRQRRVLGDLDGVLVYEYGRP